MLSVIVWFTASDCHYLICHRVIYGFWLPIWYLQTFPTKYMYIKVKEGWGKQGNDLWLPLEEFSRDLWLPLEEFSRDKQLRMLQLLRYPSKFLRILQKYMLTSGGNVTLQACYSVLSTAKVLRFTMSEVSVQHVRYISYVITVFQCPAYSCLDGTVP